MSYNPYDEEYNALSEKIGIITQEMGRLRDTIKWYESLDIEQLKRDGIENVGKVNECTAAMRIISEQYKKTTSRKAAQVATRKSTYRIWNMFTLSQRKLKDEIERLSRNEKALKRKYAIEKSSLSDLQKARNENEDTVNKYMYYNKAEAERQILNYTNELDFVSTAKSTIRRKKEEVDIELAPILKEIEIYENKIRVTRRRMERAEQYAEELNRYRDDKGKKWEIHRACEHELGEESPRAIVGNESRKLDELTKNLKKTERRANEIGRRSARVIHKIIIDGNNMCYVGNSYVGLSALKCVVRELELKYRIVVIFDASIKYKNDYSKEEIESMFSSSVIHIVPNSTEADETILNLADSDETSYILSNDNYGDYREKRAVRDNRIIKHQIIDGRVLINDLNINIGY